MPEIISKEISEILPEAYLPFSAYVIQTRALPDARDCLKTGGRYILWSQYFNKNTYDKNRKKAADVVGQVMHWNPHGDAGIYDSIVRFAKPFAMRYLLEDPKGNVGSMTAGKDHTAPRYLELRSSKLASEFTNLIKKDTIDIWKMNFTQEDEYPSVFPTLFPNFVNGNTGLGVGCISSIPCFNLNEAIESLKKLVKNPNEDYDNIYIAPDFPTGATIVNSDAVKESLRIGEGAAIKLRANIEYDEKENALIITQLPYQVFTNRVMGEIEKGIDDGRILGIKDFFDGTDKKCGKYGTGIVIHLAKGANVNRLCKVLYKETALQNSFTIKQLMLEDGIRPKLYGLKEMMLAFLNHSMLCLKKSYIYDYNKVLKAIHIDEGLLIAIENIDNIIDIIKKSDDENIVARTFKEKYNLSNEQSKAILNLKLQKLMKLESIKIEKELEKQKSEEKRLNMLINDKETFDTAYIAELDRIKKEYGDERRTKILNLDFSKEDEEEPIEQKELLIHFTNLGNFFTQESTTLLTARRGGKGAKVKLADNEVITQTISDDNMGTLLVFTNKGQMYSIATDDLPVNSKINASQLFELKSGEKITSLTTLSHRDAIDYFIFITKNGLIKKTAAKEYDKKRGKSIRAINLKDDDEVVAVHFIKNEPIGILTSQGNFVIINTEDVNAIGRATAGIRAIKLSENDFVINSQIISGKFLITISSAGLIKKASLDEFPICSRGIKGRKISGVRENDEIVSFLTLNEDCDIIAISNRGVLKFNTNDLRVLSRDATGVKAMKLAENVKIVDLVEA